MPMEKDDNYHSEHWMASMIMMNLDKDQHFSSVSFVYDDENDDEVVLVVLHPSFGVVVVVVVMMVVPVESDDDRP